MDEAVTVFYIFDYMDKLFLGALHRTFCSHESRECTRASCPEMKAGEWFYFCVAHGNNGATSMEVCFVHNTSTIDLTSCFSPRKHGCVMDYILHTIDSATALLNPPRSLPSRYDTGPIFSLYTYITYIFFSPDSCRVS